MLHCTILSMKILYSSYWVMKIFRYFCSKLLCFSLFIFFSGFRLENYKLPPRNWIQMRHESMLLHLNYHSHSHHHHWSKEAFVVVVIGDLKDKWALCIIKFHGAYLISFILSCILKEYSYNVCLQTKIIIKKTKNIIHHTYKQPCNHFTITVIISFKRYIYVIK